MSDERVEKTDRNFILVKHEIQTGKGAWEAARLSMPLFMQKPGSIAALPGERF